MIFAEAAGEVWDALEYQYRNVDVPELDLRTEEPIFDEDPGPA